MNWFKSMDTIVRRVIVISVIMLAIVLIGLTVGLCSARDKASMADANTRIAEGQTNASNAATAAVADYADRQTDRAETERKNRDEILSAPNAGDSAGPAGDAGLRVLCERAAYRSDPVCLRLKGSAATSR